MANEVSKDSSLSTVVIAALVGGIAGAAVGLMLAPKSGQELRQDIGSRARQTFQELQEVTEAKVGTMDDVREDVFREGKRLIDDLKTLFGEYRRVLAKAEIKIADETEGQPE